MATQMMVREGRPDFEKAVARLVHAIGEQPERVAKALAFPSSGATSQGGPRALFVQRF